MKLARKIPRSASRAALDVALDSAHQHGLDSDPDHEVGDLLELVEALYKYMPEESRREALLDYAEGRELWTSGGSIERSLKRC
jgi:hypothetical protein